MILDHIRVGNFISTDESHTPNGYFIETDHLYGIGEPGCIFVSKKDIIGMYKYILSQDAELAGTKC